MFTTESSNLITYHQFNTVAPLCYVVCINGGADDFIGEAVNDRRKLLLDPQSMQSSN